jgi:general secretion pathway protein C
MLEIPAKSQYLVVIMSTVMVSPRAAWLPRLSSWVSLVVLATVAGYWSMRLLAPAPLQPPPLAVPSTPEAGATAWRTLFSGSGGVTGPILLRGVITGDGRDGVAVLSIEGKPGRAFRSGTEVAPGIVLAEVKAKSVILERNGTPEEIFLAEHAKIPAR